MIMKNLVQNYLFFVLGTSALALSACSTHGTSRYGGEAVVTPPVPCGTVNVPCGQLIEYHPVTVQPPAYLVPPPCPVGQCQPPAEPSVLIHEPIVAEAPYVPPYETPIVVEPPYVQPVVSEPPFTFPQRFVDDPVITCPEGTIPSYGGQDCISLTVPRK